MARPTLLYATPTATHPSMGYVVSMRAIETTCKAFERGASDFIATTGPVQMARSAIARSTLDQGYDYVCMHDDDLQLAPTGPTGNPLDQWLTIMEAHPDVGMIGAIYLRETPPIPTAIVDHPTDSKDHLQVLAGFPYAPFEVSGIGTGFVFVRAAAIRDVGTDFKFAWQTNSFGADEQIGEDYDYAFRLRAKGWRVLADPRFPTVHHKPSGRLPFTWHDWNQKTTDATNPWQLELGPELDGARVIERKWKTLDGNEFDLSCIDLNDVKRRMAGWNRFAPPPNGATHALSDNRPAGRDRIHAGP